MASSCSGTWAGAFDLNPTYVLLEWVTVVQLNLHSSLYGKG